jgi:hypothetical protein
MAYLHSAILFPLQNRKKQDFSEGKSPFYPASLSLSKKDFIAPNRHSVIALLHDLYPILCSFFLGQAFSMPGNVLPRPGLAMTLFRLTCLPSKRTGQASEIYAKLLHSARIPYLYRLKNVG